MAITTPADVFKSPVFMGWIKNYLYANLALLGMAPYVNELRNIVWSDAGDTVTRIKFNGKVVAVDLPTDGSVPASQKVTMGSDTFTVFGKYIGLDIPSSTLEDATHKGDFDLFQGIAENVAEAMMDALDLNLIAEALTTDLEHVCAGGVIAYDDIIDARGKWGDKMTRPAMCVMHSTPYIKTLKTEDVRDLSKFGASTLQTGQVAALGGLPLHVSDNITSNATDPVTYNNLVLRHGGLGISLKRTLKYKMVPIPGDQDRHEFTIRGVVALDKQNTLPGAIKLISQ